MKRKIATMVCPECCKSRVILASLKKLEIVDGYFQCKDCHADLEYESAVIKQIQFKKGILIKI